jgi:protein-S-isoprenylcysteine O-methyltransferase Ste14/uncharacterized membrane protein (UPF0127 family)
MYRARDAASGVVLAERLRPAHTHWTRLKGLLGTRSLPPGEGLWLRPCRQVHMIGMRYAIDVVFLDDAHRVVRAISALQPGKISPKIAAATSAIELPAGTVARLDVVEGARIGIDGEPDRTASWLDTIAALIGNVTIAILFGFFAAAHFAAARRSSEWAATMPIVVQEALLAGLFLTRRQGLATSWRPFDWAVGIGGTVLPMFLRPAAQVGPLAWLGWPVQIAGLTLVIVGLMSLGRSIGIVAANRLVRTAGMYRVVRHPMYAAYMLSYLGYIASYPTARNVLITLATFIALHARAIVEERFLLQDPTYRDYAARVRWRLIPFVY